MTDTRILISTDNNGIAEFKTAVSDTCAAANNLISLFNNLQSWEKIETAEDFQNLALSPQEYFDNCLLRNVKLQTGGATPNPEVLASLVSVHRTEFISMTMGISVRSEDCLPCGRVSIKKGQRAISLQQFLKYEMYLDFAGGTFTVDENKVNADLDGFNTYADSELEQGVYNDYLELVEMLNKWDAKYFIPDNIKEQFKTYFGLYLSQASTGYFMINPETIIRKISQLKYKGNE